MQLSFGLPKFLFDQKNQLWVLLGFLVIIVVVPCGVVIWMKGGSELDKNGVSQENIMIYLSLLHDSLNFKQLLYMICLSNEFRNLKISREQEEELNMMKDYLQYIPTGKQYNPQIIKALFLLVAHIEKRKISPGLLKDQQKIVEKTLKILSTIIEAACLLSMTPKGKKISLSTFDVIFDLCQRLIQRVSFGTNFAGMLCEVTDPRLYKKYATMNDLKTLLMQNRPNLAIPPEKIDLIKSSMSFIPEYSISASVAVEGEEDIRMGDIVTFSVKIIRKFDRERNEGSCDEVFCAGDKSSTKEKIWLLMGDEKRIIFVKCYEWIK